MSKIQGTRKDNHVKKPFTKITKSSINPSKRRKNTQNDNAWISIKGAREHNLKNLSIRIPRNKLVVFTGVSGSGKSSLAFDTLYAEGQRRYIESLSSYARQFLGQMEKPKVETIEGLSPAIAIEQKSLSRNPRSTVGTVTEIYDFLRVLYARVGTQKCPKCKQEIGAQTIPQIVDKILEFPKNTRFYVLAPMIHERKGEHMNILEDARRQGFIRAKIDGEILDLSEDISLDKNRKHTIEILVDRLVIKPGLVNRLTDSIETALKLSNGILNVEILGGKTYLFSEKSTCRLCGIGFSPLTPQSFSFNSPLGMCDHCSGLGVIMHADRDLVITDPSLSIMDGALAPLGQMTKKEGGWMFLVLKSLAKKYGISLNKPFKELSPRIHDIILHGTGNESFKLEWNSKNSSGTFQGKFEGILNRIERLFLETRSEAMRQQYARYMSMLPCPSCEGSRLKPESVSVEICGKSIVDINRLSIKETLDFFTSLQLQEPAATISKELVREIVERLRFLINVGLYYLTLDRPASSLSGGESQRIRLASQIGCGLVGVLYILDEPSIGLHQRDNKQLLETLFKLRDMGNSVIVVEHDPETILSADYLFDFGPGAGLKGGQIVSYGTVKRVKESKESITGKYLTDEYTIPVPKKRRKPSRKWIKILGASEHNLKNIDVSIPIGLFTCITGVSGSGKSTLMNDILYKSLARIFYHSTTKPGKHNSITGLHYIDKVINIDQNPIGRTPRSNPATYVKVFDPIRELYSNLPLSKMRGYKPGRFSFNVKGGRCEACQGQGYKKIEMHFLPDVYITCGICKGTRFNRETLDVKFKGYNISEILDLDVEQALMLFKHIPRIKRILQTLHDVGLDYIKLGQPATTLSGGEAQRIKLSRELAKTHTGKTLYILDEPTTGLHFHDIKKLMNVISRLVDTGNTVLIIEHNMDVIKTADHVIDLGPEGGDEGGEIVATGPPEKIAKTKKSYTGMYLHHLLH